MTICYTEKEIPRTVSDKKQITPWKLSKWQSFYLKPVEAQLSFWTVHLF